MGAAVYDENVYASGRSAGSVRRSAELKAEIEFLGVQGSMISVGRNYPELVKRLGKGHKVGQPEVHVWMAGTKSAMNREDVGSRSRLR